MSRVETVDVINTLVNGEIVVTNIKKVYVNNVLNLVEYRNQEGKLHRDCDSPGGDGPAKTQYYKTGRIQYEVWYANNKLHREGDVPASIYYDYNGNIESKIWYINGNEHRDGDLPSVIYYDPKNGNFVSIEKWYKNGKLHREGDLPSYIVYFQGSTTIQREIWHKDDMRHRDPKNGPAKIDYDMEGNIIKMVYYVDGTKYHNSKFNKLIIKLHSLSDEEYQKYTELLDSLKK